MEKELLQQLFQIKIKWKLTRRESLVLDFICLMDGNQLSFRHIASETGLDPSDCRRTILKLIEKNLIVRTPCNNSYSYIANLDGGLSYLNPNEPVIGQTAPVFNDYMRIMATRKPNTEKSTINGVHDSVDENKRQQLMAEIKKRSPNKVYGFLELLSCSMLEMKLAELKEMLIVV